MKHKKPNEPAAEHEAKPQEKPEKPEREAEVEFVNAPSEVDDRTHKELCVLYKEASEAIRFAKHMQWWTVGSTLVLFFGFIGVVKFVSADMTYAKILTALTIFVAMSGIFALIMYQFWQYNEQLKIAEISKHMSTLFSRVRAIKSKREADFHRYILFLFMCATIVIGGVISYFGVQQVVEGNTKYKYTITP